MSKNFAFFLLYQLSATISNSEKPLINSGGRLHEPAKPKITFVNFITSFIGVGRGHKLIAEIRTFVYIYAPIIKKRS